MEIQHFGHHHTLTLCNMKEIGIDCSGCKQSVSGPSYGCRPCKYFLHQSCCELPLEIHHPFHPPHPLTLLQKAPYRSRRLQFTCYACRKVCSGFTYHCSDCKFDLDIECARFSPILLNNDQQIQHFTHCHPLIPVSCHDQDYRFDCSMCEQPIKGLIYVCVMCKYFIHKSCAEWPPQIQHPFHPSHSLTLLAVSQYRSEDINCYACGQGIHAGYTFHCSECQLDLHIDCAKFDGEDDQEQLIHHVSHRHPLIPVEGSKEDYRFNCSGCDLPIKGSIYVCGKCKFFVHKSCLELPQEIHHLLHPQHSLVLLPKPLSRSRKSEFNCYGCQMRCFGFTYHCPKCDFYLDATCSRNMSISQDPNDHPEIEHFTHQHPLILVTCHGESYRFNCFLCNQNVKGLVYVCVICRFFIHKSCAELPQQIQHSCHPLHPLILHRSSDLEPMGEEDLRRCHACSSDDCESLTFHCSICRFDLDTKCGLQLRSIDNNYDGQTILHCSHQHPLIPFHVENSRLICSGCFQFLDGSSYICPQCIFVVHKSCAELPEEIQHPFHPQHPLTIVSLEYAKQRLCTACGSYEDSRFIYNCAECDFNLDLRCASMKPTIKYERHEHPLLPMDHHSNEKSGDFQCSTCSSRCGDLFLRCVPCNLNLHVKCIPALPLTANHKSHRHPLILNDPLPEDDSNEYYCDACEKERNPHHSVYYCAKCEFVAHIDCAIPELTKALPAVEEESYVARQVREAGFILSDSEKIEDPEDSKHWEEEDADQESDATDSSLAALDNEIEALKAQLESLKLERARHILVSNKK
ncbi:hypothetical protein U1Q18_019296 [Sarracenia purpurea var. burkii]